MLRLLYNLLITTLIVSHLWLPLRVYAELENLPDLGDESIAVISPQQERQLGEEFMREARRNLHYLDDPELLDYIQGLGARLVAQIPQPTHPFQFYLVEDPNINAFAVPGGFITANTGLILATESEAELASVMAHEIAHISQRHIPRILAAQKRTSGLSLAALLAAILLIGNGQGQGGEAAIALSTASMVQRQLNFTRVHEQEADRVGTQIMADAGFDARAMPLFFTRLQNWSRLYETNLPEFLSTHPITTNRIAESSNRAQQYPPAKPHDESAFHHARAKIRVMSTANPQTAVKQFEINLAQGKFTNANAERYGYSLALIRNKQYAEARKQLERLLKAAPDNLSYHIAAAELEMAAQDYEPALARYRHTYKLAPGNRALLHHYPSALLKMGRAQQAMPILEQALRRYPEDVALYKMMASAAGESGDRYSAHYHMAEHYYLLDDLNNARKQLEIAARFSGDNYYRQARLEARLKQIKDKMALRARQ